MQDNDPRIAEVIQRYSKKFLLENCEALSHRLLKTKGVNRAITVQQFIEKCNTYAAMLIPGQPFNPGEIFRVKIARQIDSSQVGRFLFYALKGK